MSLATPNASAGTCTQLVGEREHPRHELVVGIDLVHETDADRGLGVDVASRHADPLRPVRADEPRDTADPSAARDHAETPHFGKAEVRARCAEPEVARRRHLQAESEARALRGEDDRLLDALHLVVQDVVTLPVLAPCRDRGVGVALERAPLLLSLVADVEPGTEVASGAGDHHHAQVLAVAETPGGLVEGLAHREVDRVELGRTIQRDREHAAALADENRVVAHARYGINVSLDRFVAAVRGVR